eukprot:Skav225171  [mRNA]  locus=scaffold1095:192211:194025:- [translate_table: standard]
MRGGGPSTTTAKSAHRIQVKNSIAASLLQEGHELSWVSQAVDTLVDKASVKAVAPLTSMPSGPARIQAIYQHMKQCNIEVPALKSTMTSQASLQHKAKKRLPVMPCPEEYTVVPGSLLYHDDSPAQQTREVHPHQRGFCLTTVDAAAPWLAANETVTCDEFALVILGSAHIDSDLPTSLHTIPCTDSQQRQVLLACTIIQLGERHIKVRNWEDQKVTPDKSTMLAITLWRDELEDQWLTISQNPFAFIRRAMNHPEAIVSMWGKSFRRNKTACPPRESTSIQVHCSIRDDSLKAVLVEGGYNHLWLTPKTQQGKPHPDWKLIWLQPTITLPETRVMGAKLSSFHGISRGHNRYALRVSAGQFAASWKQINPDIDVPEQVEANFLYKIESLPFGTTSKMLGEWATHSNIKLKAIRALGPRCWLIGTPTEVPQQQYSFNASPILLRPVKSRLAHQDDPVIAGPKPLASTQVPLHSDPWAPFFANRTPASAATSAKPAAASAGPTEQKLQEQDAKIQDIATTLQALKVQHEHTQQQFAGVQSELQARESKIIGHIDGQIQSLRQELDTSFSKALTQQSQQVDSRFQEIKALLMSSKRKEPEQGDDEM